MKRDNFWGLVGFNQQHYNITMWIAALLSYAWQWHHADGESLNWYFDLPEDTMKGNESLTTTPIFFNCDETCGNPPNPKSAKVGEKVGVKNPMQLSSAGKLQKRGRPRHHDLGIFNLSWYMWKVIYHTFLQHDTEKLSPPCSKAAVAFCILLSFHNLHGPDLRGK